MSQVRERAVIDADFFIKLTDREPKGALFENIMADLGIDPVMHEYVANKELAENSTAKQMISDGKITVIRYEDYIDENNAEEYEEYFKTAYERMNLFDFPENDIYAYEEPDENLGEIRSLYLAKSIGCSYFMSDDSGAKHFASTYFTRKKKVIVCNIFDVFVKCKELGTSLTWKQINPTVSNALHRRQDKLREIKRLYVT